MPFGRGNFNPVRHDVRRHFERHGITFAFQGPIKGGVSYKVSIGYGAEEPAVELKKKLEEIAKTCPRKVEVKMAKSTEMRGNFKTWNPVVRVMDDQ